MQEKGKGRRVEKRRADAGGEGGTHRPVSDIASRLSIVGIKPLFKGYAHTHESKLTKGPVLTSYY